MSVMSDNDKKHEDGLPQEEKRVPPESKFTNKIAYKLAKDKTPIIVENGIAKIDSSHPEYKFWLED